MLEFLDKEALALIFAGLTATAIMAYAILDGYDLGIGITMPMGDSEEAQAWRDRSIASIGPFWDANETWLVLSIGLLMVAFPAANSAILEVFYLPATILLLAIIARGVAFDFRAKAHPRYKKRWDLSFVVGSYTATAMQGFMLGVYVMGLEYTWHSVLFGVFSAFCVTAAYALIGSAWLILKTTDKLQLNAIKNAKIAGFLCFAGIVSVCLINPLVNANALDIWVSPPFAYIYALIPVACFTMFALGYRSLNRLQKDPSKGDWKPFVMSVMIFVTCFLGLALSFYPFIVPNTLTIYEAASDAQPLRIILMGTIFVLPMIILYSGFVYFAFRGKAEKLEYY